MSDESLKTQALALARLIPQEAVQLILDLQQAEMAVTRSKAVTKEVLEHLTKEPTPSQTKTWWMAMRNLLERYQELSDTIYEVCLKLGPLSDVKILGNPEDEKAFERMLELDRLIRENKLWVAPASDEVH